MRALRAASLIVLLAGFGLLAALRIGAFDPPRARGMTAQPCPAPADKKAGNPVSLLLYTLLRGDGDRRKLRDWPGLCEYSEANRKVMAGAPPRAVFIGDSVTLGWGERDPSFFRSGVVNRGINGQTSPQVLLRFQNDALALKPRVIHLMVGFNDIAGNTGPSRPDDFKNNIRAMADLAAAAGVPLVIGSLPPTRSIPGWPGKDPRPRISELNRWLRQFASERGLAFADYHAVLAKSDGSAQPQFTDDGLHPNAAGYAAIQPVARAALARAEAGAQSSR